MSFVSSSGWREMISLLLVPIFLVANCLARVTAADGFTTETKVSVTPINGQLLLGYKQSVQIKDYNKVNDISIKIDVSINRKIDQ